MTPDEMIAMTASSGAELRMVLDAQPSSPEHDTLYQRAETLFKDLETLFGAQPGHFWQKIT